jgi:hypothetical protein
MVLQVCEYLVENMIDPPTFDLPSSPSVVEDSDWFAIPLRGIGAGPADEEHAREAVDALRGAGLRVHLLSGDHPAAVAALAARLGIADPYRLPARRRIKG